MKLRSRGDDPVGGDYRSDLDLVRRTLGGDRHAVERFMQRMGCIRRILHHKNARHGHVFAASELEDVIQDTLFAVWRKLANYSGRGALEAWAYRFAYIEFVSRLRSRSRTREHGDDALGAGAADLEAPSDPDPDDYESLYRGLERLGSPAADVIRLKHLENRTFGEIGRELAMSPNSAKTLYYRGLRKLRGFLERSAPSSGALR